MKTSNFLTSSCRFCRYYQTEGRRGGMCQQLGVPVRAEWKACSLAVAPFTHTWESLEKVVKLENSLVLKCSTDIEAVEEFSSSIGN
ncbi:hypothetical protein [Crocosphaera chwakensis]|uniref:Uncharacterized protein n=1 Tax=Crocosphaera chwakensis CCY0110 TaxID=391612 RepID=A3ILE3_9CHRO|nr:hypothetical protein [Crocosphaera chwakensis]EAZ92594.1 hypothetical protein CY0110_23546 [Crocosphaera chwakensis CCY0110]